MGTCLGQYDTVLIHHAHLVGSIAEDIFTERNLIIIKGKFDSLRQDMCSRLKDKLSEEQIQDELHPYLLAILPDKAARCIPSSSNLKDIFQAMTYSRLWNYLNYCHLEALVEKFGDEDMISQVEQYKKDRSSFQVATKIKHYIPAAKSVLAKSDAPVEPSPLNEYAKYYWKLEIKLDERVTDYSLEYLEQLWKSLANTLRLPPISLVLDTILRESVLVVWLIPAELGPNAIKMANQCVELFSKYRPLLTVTIGDQLVYKKGGKVKCLDLESLVNS